MKNKFDLIIMLCLIIVGLTITSCEKQISGCTDSTATNYNPNATDNDGSCQYCNGMGTLRLTNTSASNYHKIIIDGVNYGSLDPGYYKDYSLAAGSHTFEFQPLSGSGGCSSASVIIVACQTSSFNCNG